MCEVRTGDAGLILELPRSFPKRSGQDAPMALDAQVISPMACGRFSTPRRTGEA
jgi:hypothetical protein